MKILSIENGYNRNIINYEEQGKIKQFIFSREKSIEAALEDLKILCANKQDNYEHKDSIDNKKIENDSINKKTVKETKQIKYGVKKENSKKK